MIKIFIIIILSAVLLGQTNAQNRFPQPDFESGYQYPEKIYPVSNEALWVSIDILMLVLLMSFVAWAVIRKRTRQPIIWTSIISVVYFGFFRKGCVCSIGAIQNVSLALADSTYILPISALLFFILPIIFAYLFGRVFCAGVCPFGALQELVNIKNYRLAHSVTKVLELIPWIYLIFAVLYAITRTSFIICRFDPFIGIFRLGGDFGLILFGSLLLVASIFIGRPFCRFLCPYGVILGLFSKVSFWKIKLTKIECINCELCNNACPVDAIKPNYENKVKESRAIGVRRIVNYFIILPLLIIAGAIIMRSFSNNFSNSHKHVRLHQMVEKHEANPQNRITKELEAYYNQGLTFEELSQQKQIVQADFKKYSTIAGAAIGLLFGLSLISLSVKRSRKYYEIEHSDCVACGKCFSYCPQNLQNK
jgi:NosR/NirI family transcriptional regulator, nitrous oxide reductase regulator